ncbi:hypothetical protein P3S67_012324 [Capsicum chacoense]
MFSTRSSGSMISLTRRENFVSCFLLLTISLCTFICMFGLPFLAKCKSSLSESCPGTGLRGNYKHFNCPNGYYIDLATLILTTKEDAIRNIKVD